MSKHRRTDDSETKHHRKSRKNGGETNEKNISYVPFHQHMAYNALFSDGHLTAVEIAKVLTKTWIDPDWILFAIPRCDPCTRCQTCLMEETHGR